MSRVPPICANLPGRFATTIGVSMDGFPDTTAGRGKHHAPQDLSAGIGQFPSSSALLMASSRRSWASP